MAGNSIIIIIIMWRRHGSVSHTHLLVVERKTTERIHKSSQHNRASSATLTRIMVLLEVFDVHPGRSRSISTYRSVNV